MSYRVRGADNEVMEHDLTPTTETEEERLMREFKKAKVSIVFNAVLHFKSYLMTFIFDQIEKAKTKRKIAKLVTRKRREVDDGTATAR